MPPKRMSTSEAPVMTQAAIRKLVADSVTIALEVQAANMANTNKITELVFSHSNCIEDYKVKFATETFNKKILSPEVQKIEDEFYHLTVKGNDLKTYVRRFQELATLCPIMVPDSKKMMEVFIGGLPQSIEGNFTASKP
ncbi:reverse transcriptase domain-containing protein, partial [Tanacetum coccineum]